MLDLTAFQRDLLIVIAIRDRYDRVDTHGLAIKSHLEQLRGEDINHGRLYPNLDELNEAELIEKGERDGRTNTYALTDTGLDCIGQHFARLEYSVGDRDAPEVDAVPPELTTEEAATAKPY